ncbi:hypothetical protein DFH07DRAFT_974186 [Mycena maculata]|uniref:Uncharacterized protein n=1 Tax=Mycena maculata TaxID=230809 RepID=A0AAD7MG66_9AGAR|nr:hypothetical protein DFH07DRAFT_974186 [Mycena maculata]
MQTQIASHRIASRRVSSPLLHNFLLLVLLLFVQFHIVSSRPVSSRLVSCISSHLVHPISSSVPPASGGYPEVEGVLGSAAVIAFRVDGRITYLLAPRDPWNAATLNVPPAVGTLYYQPHPMMPGANNSVRVNGVTNGDNPTPLSVEDPNHRPVRLILPELDTLASSTQQSEYLQISGARQG